MKRLFAVSVLVLLLTAAAWPPELPEGVEADGRMLVMHILKRNTGATESLALEVEEVSCEEVWTRVSVAGEGRVGVRAGTLTVDPSIDIVVAFDRLEIFGGYRDTLMVEDSELVRHEDGSISGYYEFKLWGPDPETYGFHMDLECD